MVKYYDFYERKNADGTVTYIRLVNGLLVDHVDRQEPIVRKGVTEGYAYVKATEEDKALIGKTVEEIKAMGFRFENSRTIN